MTKSEKTVRALEDQFYGRSKEIDAQLLKSLRKADARKLSQRKQPAAEGGQKFKHSQQSIYKGYEMPKRKERKNPNGSKAGQDGGSRMSTQLSFAENLKNLLAN